MVLDEKTIQRNVNPFIQK